MARRNRRKKKQGFIVALPWAAVLVAIVVLMLMYVWLDARGQALGSQIKSAERQRDEISKRYSHELWKWEALKSPASIEQTLSEHRIAMIWPDEDHIVRLSEGTRGREAPMPRGDQMAKLSGYQGFEVND